MHYFVTGASGFLGGYVTVQLLDGGHEVTALVRDRDEAREIADYGVRPHVGSVTDRESLERVMPDVDGVFHLEGHRVDFPSRARLEAVNVGGTRNVLDLVAARSIAKVVLTSTLGVFGDTKGEVVDENAGRPDRHPTEHDAAKARAYFDVALPGMDDGVPAVVVLPGAIYGPRDTGRMADSLARYLGGGLGLASTRTASNWAHVEDVARAHLQAMQFGRSGESYIVAGERATVREVLARAGRLAGRRVRPLPVPSWLIRPVAGTLRSVSRLLPSLRPLAERTHVAGGVTYLGSDDKARAELGFSPRSLDEGLPDVVRWLLHDRFELELR